MTDSLRNTFCTDPKNPVQQEPTHGTEYSETSAYINQTPGNHPKENKQQKKK